MAEMSAEELANLFACSLRTVTSLANEGIIKRTARGRHDGPASITGYVRHLREAAAGRRPTAAVAPLSALAATLDVIPDLIPARCCT